MWCFQSWLKSITRDSATTCRIPLVSCIMPTYNRRPFVAQAIRYFRRQDYANKELIIVDDGDDSLRDMAADADDIRYIRLDARTPIGEKRNIAIAHSSGTIIAHWDDDDWYDSSRLSYQVAPLLSGVADVTGLHMSFMYDLLGDVIWHVDSDLHRTMFVGGIHTGSIIYTTRIWSDVAQFRRIDLGEDVVFLRELVSKGMRLLRLPNDAALARLGFGDNRGELAFLQAIDRAVPRGVPLQRPATIYVRHGINTWRFACGEHIRSEAWHSVAPDRLLPADDLAYYRAMNERTLVAS
jgi:glycosyltransferase involved in cell wall biosynthesis